MSSHWEAETSVGSSWMQDLHKSSLSSSYLTLGSISMPLPKGTPHPILLALSNDPVMWEKPVTLASGFSQRV